MKKTLAAVIFVVFCAVGIVQAPRAAYAALGVDFTSDVAAQGLVENGGPGTFIPGSTGYTTVGWSFKPTVDLYLTRLGVFDADRDRIHSEQHQIGIWSAANPSSMLASVTIDEAIGNLPTASPNGALFHFANVASPVILSAGQTYYVGATLYAGAVVGGGTADFDSFAAFKNGDSPVYINPYITYLGNAYAISANNNLVFPSSNFAATDYTIGANIDVTPVPIPAAAWLLGSGLMGLFGARRWKACK